MKTFLILVLCWLGLCYSAQAAVNINTANQTELESLPGIGPVKAKAILEYRKKNGGFKSVDELTRVDGIGPVTLKNARNDIVLDASATSKPTALSAYPKSHADSKKTLKQAAPTKPAPAKVSPLKVKAGGVNPGKSGTGISQLGKSNPAKQQVITEKPIAIKPSSQKTATKKP